MFCHKCGNEALVDAAFCRKCGTKLTVEELDQPGSEDRAAAVVEPVSSMKLDVPDIVLSQNDYNKTDSVHTVHGPTGEGGKTTEEKIPSQTIITAQQQPITQLQPITQQQPITQLQHQDTPTIWQEAERDATAEHSQPATQPITNNAELGANAKPHKFPIKTIMAVAIPIVALIVVAILVLPLLLSRGDKGDSTEFGEVPHYFVKTADISFFREGDNTVVSSGGNAPFTIPGILGASQVSLDGSKAALLANYDDESGGALWFVTPGGASLIEHNVYGFMLAQSGDGLVYMSDYYDGLTAIYSLYYYDTTSGFSRLLTEDYIPDYNSTLQRVCISPDGKSVGFISGFDTYKDLSFTGYTLIDGRSIEILGEKVYATAISNGGSYIYYVDETDFRALYVRSEGHVTMLSSDYSIGYMSGTGAQFVFQIGDSTYISRNGGKRKRIGVFCSLVPIRQLDAYSANSYANCIYKISDTASPGSYLAYINDSLEITKIHEARTYQGTESAVISSDGSTMLFTDSNTDGEWVLWSVDLTSPAFKKTEVVTGAQRFAASADGRSIYYSVSNGDNTLSLWFVNDGSVPVMVADNIFSRFVVPHNSSIVYFLANYNADRGRWDLFTADFGEDNTTSFVTTGVIHIWGTIAGVYYLTKEDELFARDGNGDFTLVLKGFHQWSNIPR